jgi:hypothetical protein
VNSASGLAVAIPTLSHPLESPSIRKDIADKSRLLLGLAKTGQVMVEFDYQNGHCTGYKIRVTLPKVRT